jgi:hypothetical protein
MQSRRALALPASSIGPPAPKNGAVRMTRAVYAACQDWAGLRLCSHAEDGRSDAYACGAFFDGKLEVV